MPACLVDVLDHWCGRTSEEPVGHHQIQGLQSRFKGLHRQRRDGLLRGQHEGLHRRRRGSVLVVAARGAIPFCTVAATKVATFTVATSVETTTDACTAEAAMTKTAYYGGERRIGSDDSDFRDAIDVVTDEQ